MCSLTLRHKDRIQRYGMYGTIRFCISDAFARFLARELREQIGIYRHTCILLLPQKDDTTRFYSCSGFAKICVGYLCFYFVCILTVTSETLSAQSALSSHAVTLGESLPCCLAPHLKLPKNCSWRFDSDQASWESRLFFLALHDWRVQDFDCTE